MEFLNGIVEKLAPIHEKILDLTNPLTLTIEEYVPQLASFHDQLIYVLILAAISLFGLLRKVSLRLTRARLPRRIGPEMRMSRSSEPSTPTPLSPKFKGVVHGRVLDYDAQSSSSQPMGPAPAFGTAQQPPVAAQGSAISKMGTPVFDFNSFAGQPAANPDHAAQSHVTPQTDSVSSEPIASDATPFVPERQAEAPAADAPHAAEEEPQAKREEGPSASWKEPDAPTAEERLARLYPNMESEFQNLYINLYADQELTTDFSDLRNSVSRRILQNQSPLPLFDPGQGDTRDLLLAHIANSARDVIEKLSEDRQGDRPKFDLHEQELHKIYRCVLYRLNDSGLIDEEAIERLVQEARDLTSNR